MPGAQPRVSVVIPAYRNADFVAETIESVLAFALVLIVFAVGSLF